MNTVYVPIEGEILPLSDVSDTTCASGALGERFAIRPAKGMVTAPFDGGVSMVFDTKHAIGLKSNDGITSGNSI